MRWSKYSLITSVVAIVAAATEYNGLSRRPSNGDIRWDLDADKIEALSVKMIQEEVDFVKSMLAVENPTVDNVLIPTIDRDNHLSSKINEIDFYQYIANDEVTRTVASQFKQKLKKSDLEFGVTEDLNKPYRVLLEKLRSGEEPATDPEYMKYLEDMMKDANRTAMSVEDFSLAANILDEIDALEIEFNKNVNNLQGDIILSGKELEGVPQSSIDVFQKAYDEHYRVKLDASQIFQILRYARNNTVRKTVSLAFYDQAPENEEVLKKIVKLRYEHAKLYGYNTHAEYVLRNRMAKTQKTVIDFMYDVEDKIKPVAEKEIAHLLELKNADLREQGLPEEPELYNWDYDYYHTAMLQKEFQVDQVALAEYFPTKKIVPKLLRLFEKLYDVAVVQLTPEFDDAWHPDVMQFAVYQYNRKPKNGQFKREETEDMSDFPSEITLLYETHPLDPNAGKEYDHDDEDSDGDEDDEQVNVYDENYQGTGKATDPTFMGYLCLDIYARENKFSQAAALEIGAAFQSLKGNRVPAYVSVLCSVPPELENSPSLITPQLMSMLFHELGHGFHILLSKTKTVKYSGSHVPVDFIECPSQVLEGFMSSPKVLKSISHHYKDASKIPDEMVENFSRSLNVNAASNALRQLYAANFDMEIHIPENQQELDDLDIKSAWNLLEKDVSLIGNGDTWNNGFSQFTHMVQGYDAGYYSYIWSLVYARDIFKTLFDGVENIKENGVKLRDIVLKNGGLENPMVYLTELLGRAPSSDAFLALITQRSSINASGFSSGDQVVNTF